MNEGSFVMKYAEDFHCFVLYK